MREYGGIFQSVVEIATEHKMAVSTILASIYSSLIGFPIEILQKASIFLTIILTIHVIFSYKKGKEKTSLEIEILRMQLKQEQAAAEQRRRKEDLTPEA
jgi:hypothetical protein